MQVPRVLKFENSGLPIYNYRRISRANRAVTPEPCKCHRAPLGQGAGSRSGAIVAGARREEAPPRQMGTALMRRLPRAAPRHGGLPPGCCPPQGCPGNGALPPPPASLGLWWGAVGATPHRMAWHGVPCVPPRKAWHRGASCATPDSLAGGCPPRWHGRGVPACATSDGLAQGCSNLSDPGQGCRACHPPWLGEAECSYSVCTSCDEDAVHGGRHNGLL